MGIYEIRSELDDKTSVGAKSKYRPTARKLTNEEWDTVTDNHSQPIQAVLSSAGLSRRSMLTPQEVERADILAENGWPKTMSMHQLRRKIILAGDSAPEPIPDDDEWDGP